MDLFKDISLKMFWIGGGIYQPFFEFTETGQRQQDVINNCYIYAKRIKGRNNSVSVATKQKNYLRGTSSDSLKHAFSTSERADPEFSFMKISN